MMNWQRHTGATPTERTGPQFDHTFEQKNESGIKIFIIFLSNLSNLSKL